jgi:hypothetical protein
LHPSIGGFLRYNEWNSMIESLSFRISFICLPIQIKQGLNPQQIAIKLKEGIKIEREYTGSFQTENISTTHGGG